MFSNIILTLNKETKMTRKILLFSATILAVSAMPVLADGHGEDARRGLGHHDTNGDGTITKDEFLAHAEKRFAKMDANGDGTITRGEAKEAREKMREKRKERREKRREKRLND